MNAIPRTSMFIGKVRKVDGKVFKKIQIFLQTAASIILLIIGTVCSFTVSLFLHKLLISFDGRCLLDAHSVFDPSPNTPDVEGYRRMPPIDQTSADLDFYTKPILRLDEVFDPDYVKFLVDDPKTELPREQVFSLYSSK